MVQVIYRVRIKSTCDTDPSTYPPIDTDGNMYVSGIANKVIFYRLGSIVSGAFCFLDVRDYNVAPLGDMVHLRQLIEILLFEILHQPMMMHCISSLRF